MSEEVILTCFQGIERKLDRLIDEAFVTRHNLQRIEDILRQILDTLKARPPPPTAENGG